MKRNLLLLFTLSAFTFVSGQTIENRVTSDAGFVLSINLKSLSQKINFNDLSQYSFLKSKNNSRNFRTSTLIKELFRLPEKAAFDKTSKVFIYSEDHDSVHHISYLIPITSSKVFEERVLELFNAYGENPKIKKEKKLKVIIYDHYFSIGIYKDYALLSTWNRSYYYANDYEEYNIERAKVERMIDSVRTVKSGGTFDRPPMSAEEEVNEPYEEVIEVESAREEIVEVEAVEAPEIVEEVDEKPSIVEEEVEAAVEDVGYDEYEYYSYENDSLMLAFERKWVKIREDNEKKYWENIDNNLISAQKGVSTMKSQNSIVSRKDINTLFQKTDDIVYWFNYDGYSEKLLDVVRDRYSYSYRHDTAEYNKRLRNTPKNTLKELLNNNSFYGLGNFDKGLMKMNFLGNFNSLFSSYVSKCYGDTINPEFFKYIKSDNLIGLMGMSINAEEIANLYYEIFNRAIESVSIPNKYMHAAIELSDMFLNKETMYHTFKGDAIVAITGMQTKLNKYNSYEYDTLTFESHSVEKTKTEYMPEFVSILTIQNMDNVKRLLKLFVNLEGLIQINENLYTFNTRKKEIKDNFFVAIKNDLLFITNDKSLATEQLKNGLSSIRTLANAIPQYTQNTSFAYWNASNMFKQMSDGNPNSTSPDMFTKIGEKINGGQFVSKPIKGNTMEYELTIDMKNRENSSLLEFMDLFEMMSEMKPFRF